MIEFIGIVASSIIVISFFLDGETKLRSFNILGSIIFVIYGVLIGSISIVFLNLVSTVVNLVKINKLKKDSKLRKSE